MATNTERTIYVIELRDKFTKGMRGATTSADRFNRSVAKVKGKTDGLSKSFGKLGIMAKVGLAAAAYGMGRLGLAAVQTAAKFESVEKAFEVLLGDKGLGGKLMGWAKEFSRSTIITFDQTVTSIRKLLAYGISEQNIRPLTKMLSTIAAGVGTDRLPYLTLALGQVKSRGRLMGTELRQFREHGVDIISELAKGIGKSTPQVEEMVTKGLVSFDMVVAAMQQMTGEGGRFSGMLEEMAKTTEGRMNIIRSTWSMFMAEMGDILIIPFSKFMDILTPKLEKLTRLDWSYLGNEMGRFVGTMSALRDVFTKKSIFRIIYEELVIFTFNMSGIADKLTTELDIAGGAFKRAGDLVGSFFRAFRAEMSNDFEGRDREYSNMRTAWGNLGNQSEYAQQQRDAFAMRQWRRDTDMRRQLRGNVLPQDPFETGAYVPGSDVLGGESGGKAKKKTTSRRAGTGARDIIINIGNLIENVTNNNSHYDKNVEAMQEQLRRALLTVVNDVSQTME